MKSGEWKRLWRGTFQLAKTSFLLRNEGTWLGLLWYLLNPLLLFFLTFSIFSDRLGSSISGYPIYLILGIIMFNYFQSVTNECVSVIKDNANLIKSINFPLEALVLKSVLAFTFSHVVELAVLVIVFIYVGSSPIVIIFYPIAFLFLVMFSAGVGLIMASVSVYVFDMDNIWAFASRLLWLGTPIFYAIEGQSRLLAINMFNPLYFIITFARSIMVEGVVPAYSIIFGTVGYSVAILMVGWVLFSVLKGKFAELI